MNMASAEDGMNAALISLTVAMAVIWAQAEVTRHGAGSWQRPGVFDLTR